MKYLHSSRTHNNQIRSNPQQNSSPNLPVLKTKKKKNAIKVLFISNTISDFPSQTKAKICPKKPNSKTKTNTN